MGQISEEVMSKWGRRICACVCQDGCSSTVHAPDWLSLYLSFKPLNSPATLTTTWTTPLSSSRCCSHHTIDWNKFSLVANINFQEIILFKDSSFSEGCGRNITECWRRVGNIEFFFFLRAQYISTSFRSIAEKPCGTDPTLLLCFCSLHQHLIHHSGFMLTKMGN